MTTAPQATVHTISSRKAHSPRGLFLSLIAVAVSPPSFQGVSWQPTEELHFLYLTTHAYACIRVIAYRSTTKVLYLAFDQSWEQSRWYVSLCLTFTATALQPHRYFPTCLLSLSTIERPSSIAYYLTGHTVFLIQKKRLTQLQKREIWKPFEISQSEFSQILLSHWLYCCFNTTNRASDGNPKRHHCQ